MAKTLGLDLGTNSIGWAIVEYFKEINIQFKLQDKGVLVFDAGVLKNEKGNYKSKTADRRESRSPRKLKLNRKKRKVKTLEVLAKYKMCPLVIDENVNEVELWKKSNFTKYPLKPEFIEWLRTDDKLGKNPYYLRSKASKEKVSNYELGRAFYHIAQRRGFLSNRLDQTDDSKIENTRDKIKEIILEKEFSINEIIEQINDLFVENDFDNKPTKDLDDTERTLNRIRKYVLEVLNDKVKEKSFKTKEDKLKEIEEYLEKVDNMGPVKKDISQLNSRIEIGGFKTLGQYFFSLYNKEFDIENKEKGTKITVERTKIRKHYTSREEHYLVEFEEICKIQKLEGINENEKSPEKKYFGIVKELYKAIFYQRPLKSQKGLVGYCTLQTNKKRCSLSRPEFEEFRMLTFISNIKIKMPINDGLRFLDEKLNFLIITKHIGRKWQLAVGT